MVSDEERRDSRLSFFVAIPNCNGIPQLQRGRLALNTHVIETDFPAIVA